MRAHESRQSWVPLWRGLEVYRRHVFFLSASRLISITGSIAAYVALVAVLYDRSNHSGTWVAAGLVVSFGVSAVLGPWAGDLATATTEDT